MFKIGFRIPSLAIIILPLMMPGGCELFADKNEDCDATKMIDLKEPTIYLRAEVFPGQLMIDSDLTYKLRNATKIEIKGSVQKVYCSGKKSGYFAYSPNFFPNDYTDNALLAGLFLPQPYEYKFENDLDKLIVIVTCKAWFSDGKIFETDTVSEDFFYKDIKYEVNEMRYYFKILLSTEFSIWKQVMS